MINSAVAWLGFFQRYTKFSVLGHPNQSAESSPYGSIFYAFHLAWALVNCGLRTMFIFKCLTLSRFVGHSVYCCCCCNCVFVCCCFFFPTGNAKKITASTFWRTEKLGKGKLGMHEFVLKIIWRQSKLNHVHGRSLSLIHRLFIYFPSFFVFVNLPVDIFFVEHVSNVVQVEVQ